MLSRGLVRPIYALPRVFGAGIRAPSDVLTGTIVTALFVATSMCRLRVSLCG